MKEDFHTNTNRIRVLMDSQAFDFQTHGGISRCFVGLISHMPEDIDLSLPILETHNQYLKEMGMAPERDYYMEFCNGHPTSINRFWYKILTNIRHGHWRQWDRMPHHSIFEVERQLKRGEFDVFHPTYFDPYFLDRIGKKPFVLTVHDMISERYSDSYRFHDGQLQGKRKLIPRAAHIIAVSEHTKQDIVDLFDISPEKISLSLKSTITMKLYFKTEDIADITSFEYRKNQLTTTASGDYTIVIIEGIPATNFSGIISIKCYLNEGDEYKTVKIKPSNYAYIALKQPVGGVITDDLKEVVRALYQFSLAANEYNLVQPA